MCFFSIFDTEVQFLFHVLPCRFTVRWFEESRSIMKGVLKIGTRAGIKMSKAKWELLPPKNLN